MINIAEYSDILHRVNEYCTASIEEAFALEVRDCDSREEQAKADAAYNELIKYLGGLLHNGGN